MSQNLTKWTYNDVELELDIADAHDAEKYDKCFRAMAEAEKAFKKDLPGYQVIRNYCGLYKDLFDSLFGEGTYQRLTGGKTENINVAHDVYDSFLRFVKGQSEFIQNSRSKFAKYSSKRVKNLPNG